MTRIIWDEIGERIYETGLDRGVLYLPDDECVPWNGLTSVEVSDGEVKVNPYYLDGVKYYNERTLGDFAAVLKAYTYPDEFIQFDGYQEVATGLFITDQPAPETFNLSYRTLINNDVSGSDYGYKIHLLYNLSAAPSSSSFVSTGKSTDPMDFSWDIAGIPIEVEGFRPAVHFVIDSRSISQPLLASIEALLYGDENRPGRLPQFDELRFIFSTNLTSVVDNGDGTWTVTGPDDAIFFQMGGFFEIHSSAATFLDAETYQITDQLTLDPDEEEPVPSDPNAVSQTIVVPQNSITVGQPTGRMALFNPDGTPFVSNGSTVVDGGGDIALDEDGVPYWTGS